MTTPTPPYHISAQQDAKCGTSCSPDDLGLQTFSSNWGCFETLKATSVVATAVQAPTLVATTSVTAPALVATTSITSPLVTAPALVATTSVAAPTVSATNLLLATQATLPTAPVSGQLIWNGAALQVYSGTAWLTVTAA